ncbi:MAG: hypothetical protein M3077_04815 [Candidatus Dormibacteraeota bacterium]|nr:hypothetical protein [Candidatus Dormibacteraeota bacterium]
MKVFRVRTQAAMVGLRLLAGTMGVLGAGSGGAGSLRYEVTAPLRSVGGGPVYACYSYDLMPADPCGGVLLKGVDMRTIPTVQGYAENATLETGPVRLVGRWENGALILTEPPGPATNETPFPDPCKQDVGFVPQADMLALQDRVIRDSAFQSGQIQMIRTLPCEGKVGILVVVADAGTVAYLTRRYPAVVVAGWLQPVQPGF